jgi:hypothetical protein
MNVSPVRFLQTPCGRSHSPARHQSDLDGSLVQIALTKEP